MDQVLAAVGIFGVVAAVLLGSLVCVVQPIWAIVDCVDSERERDTKVLVSVLIFFTWCAGGLFYGLFFASSRNLRIFTVAMLVVVFLMVVGGLGACTMGAFRAAEKAKVQEEIERREAKLRLEQFAPAPIAADAVAPFPALLVVGEGTQRSASVADFTLAGPVAASARDVDDDVRHVVRGNDALFAITDHDFGAVSPTTGSLVEIGIDPRLEKDFSWPKGLAWDAASQKIVILTSHVTTRLFTYDPRTAAWELLPAERRGEPLVGLAWLPEDGSLYALEVPRHDLTALTTLQRFNVAGANLGALRLDPPIPLPPGLGQGFQLQARSGKLLLLVPPHDPRQEEDAAFASEARIYAIDPDSGAVFAPEG